MPSRGLKALIGMSGEFKRGDKISYLLTIGWTFLLIIIFILGTIYNLVFDVKPEM